MEFVNNSTKGAKENEGNTLKNPPIFKFYCNFIDSFNLIDDLWEALNVII